MSTSEVAAGSAQSVGGTVRPRGRTWRWSQWPWAAADVASSGASSEWGDKEAFLRSRVDRLIRLNDGRASWNHRTYKALRIVIVVCAALIPLVSGAGDRVIMGGFGTGAEQQGKLTLVAILGVVIVVLEGLLQLFQSHDHWIRYRSTADALRREKAHFIAQAGDYQTDDEAERYRRLAARTEAIWAEHREQWARGRLTLLASESQGSGRSEGEDGMADPDQRSPTDARNGRGAVPSRRRPA